MDLKMLRTLAISRFKDCAQQYNIMCSECIAQKVVLFPGFITVYRAEHRAPGLRRL